MIAVDTNVLVYAHRADSPWHERSAALISRLAHGRSSWGIPWPCVHEFLATVTSSRAFRQPTPVRIAIDQAAAWLESPSVELLSEGSGYWPVLRALLDAGTVSGPMVHDARIAALSLYHGVRELWTADRDFSRFPGLTVRNPLISP